MSAQIQTSFSATLSKEFAPMLTLDGALKQLLTGGFDYDDESLRADLDEGHFEWAWNIGSSDALRRELRIFTPCVDEHLRWLLNPKTTRRRYTIDDVARALFPLRAGKPWVESPDIRRAFLCSQELVILLIDDGSLRELPGTNYSRGAGGAAKIEWPSVLNFLTTRKI